MVAKGLVVRNSEAGARLMLCDVQIFWFNHYRQPRLESVVDAIFRPRNRHEVRAALAMHRRRWKKQKAGGRAQ